MDMFPFTFQKASLANTHSFSIVKSSIYHKKNQYMHWMRDSIYAHINLVISSFFYAKNIYSIYPLFCVFVVSSCNQSAASNKFKSSKKLPMYAARKNKQVLVFCT